MDLFRTGKLLALVLPSPNTAYSPLPQVKRSPTSFNACVYHSPAAIEIKGGNFLRAFTTVGFLADKKFPCPSAAVSGENNL